MRSANYENIPDISDINAENFWSRVEIKDKHNCWPWLNLQRTSRKKDYYPSYYVNGKPYTAHLIVCILRGDNLSQFNNGKVSAIRHLCDNKRCCNPDHILFSTQSENVRDVHRKGGYIRTKLSYDDIVTIRILRSQGISYKELSNRFNVSMPTIRNCVIGKGIYGEVKDRLDSNIRRAKIKEGEFFWKPPKYIFASKST